MSTDSPESAPVTSPAAPEDLPPVTPPSAGFIIQLFLIPALIVAAVVGVWALFNQLAGSEVNMEQLVAELGSSNKHRRWRSALNLSQLLQNERVAAPEGVQRLAERRDVAEALSGLLSESLDSTTLTDEDIRNQDFLARTMGSLHVDDVVLPVLARTLDPAVAPSVRRSGLMSTVLIAGRHFAVQTDQPIELRRSMVPDLSPLAENVELPLPEPTISNPAILDALKTAAQDSEASIRHLAAYALGLVSGPDAISQLKVLLLDADESTQVNAAIALARNADVSGVPAIINVLQAGLTPPTATVQDSPEADEQQARLEFDQSARLVNCITASSRLWLRLAPEQQDEIRKLVTTLEQEHSSPGVRLHANSMLRSLP